MIKLIISDVDGTLLPTGDTKISEALIDRINAIQTQGIQFAAASGRQYSSLKRLFEKVDKEIYYIAENGAYIVYKGRTLSTVPVNKMLGFEVIQDIWGQDNCEFLLSGRDVCYVIPKQISFFEEIENVYEYDCRIISDLNEVAEDFLKISVYNRNGIGSCASHFTNKWGDRLNVAVAGECWLDITNRYANKGVGVSYIRKALGISREDTMTFGDSYNDLEMFEESYFSYAIGKADLTVKQSARYITHDVESILLDVLRIR